jgi:hypothetical protein
MSVVEAEARLLDDVEYVERRIAAWARIRSSSELPMLSLPYGELEAAESDRSLILDGTAIEAP